MLVFSNFSELFANQVSVVNEAWIRDSSIFSRDNLGAEDDPANEYITAKKLHQYLSWHQQTPKEKIGYLFLDLCYRHGKEDQAIKWIDSAKNKEYKDVDEWMDATLCKTQGNTRLYWVAMNKIGFFDASSKVQADARQTLSEMDALMRS